MSAEIRMLPEAPRPDAGRAEWLASVLALGPSGILARVEAAGLRGRGGLGRPVADRWRLCAAQADAERTVVLSTYDPDPEMPAAATLLASDPRAVLEGLLIAAHAVGATRALLFVDREDEALPARLEAAVAGLGAAKPAGLAIGIAPGEARYVCREDTALLASMAGRPAMSALTPPLPAVRGFEGRPTVVHHAETCAQIAALFRADASAAPGPGTKLFRVFGDVRSPGLFERPLGTTLRALVEDAGGLPEGRTLQFVQVGGPGGPILVPSELDAAADYAAFEGCGWKLGSGSLSVRAMETCVVDYVRERTAALEPQACGRCVMGREGSWQIQAILRDMTSGRGKPEDLETLAGLAEGMRDGCLCSVCPTAGDVAATAAARFPEEFENHLRKKKCRTLSCSRYATFHILPDKCTGCGACLPKCPTRAISGEDGYIHVIDPDTCDSCGICEDVCRPIAAAIVRAGAVKPQTPPAPIPVGTFVKKAGLGGLGGLRRPSGL